MVGPQSKTGSLKEFIGDTKKLVGKDAPDVTSGVNEADWSSIQRYGAALGDTNKLYNSITAGVGSVFNTVIAPPGFIFSIRTPDSGGTWEQRAYGLRRFSTRASIEWNDVIRMADRVGSDIKVAAVRDGKRWGDRPTAEVDSTVTYKTIHGGVVATATGTTTLVPYQLGEPLIEDRDIHVYTKEETAKVERELDAVPPHRGDMPLYWSELKVGDKVPTLVKGPLYYNEIHAWRLLEHKPESINLGTVTHRHLLARPGRITVNPSTQWPYFDVEDTFGDILSIQALGFRMPAARGLLRVACAAQLLTNWMGDLGFLRRLSLDLPNHFLYQDTMSLSGEVTKHYKDKVGSEEYHAVDVKVFGKNQLGQTLVDGTATVYLPERGFLVGLPIGKPWR